MGLTNFFRKRYNRNKFETLRIGVSASAIVIPGFPHQDDKRENIHRPSLADIVSDALLGCVVEAGGTAIYLEPKFAECTNAEQDKLLTQLPEDVDVLLRVNFVLDKYSDTHNAFVKCNYKYLTRRGDLLWSSGMIRGYTGSYFCISREVISGIPRRIIRKITPRLIRQRSFRNFSSRPISLTGSKGSE